MARNVTHFLYAERGPTSVYKFRFDPGGPQYVWFEYGGDGGSLHRSLDPGPYDVNDPLEDADYEDLDTLLRARNIPKELWIEDLMAQYGERIEWKYP